MRYLLLLLVTFVTMAQAPSADTTISVGTIAGQVLAWVAAAFAVPIGTLLSVWLYRLMGLAGVQTTEAMRNQLQAIIVNGLNAAAANTSERLKGQGPLSVKNAIIQDTIRYTQVHGEETIKALGLDPHSGAAVEVIKARIETAITDPLTPTPAVVAPKVELK